MTDYGQDLQFGTFLTPDASQSDRVVELALLTETSGLDLATIAQNSERLLTGTRQERAALPYMHPGRVDVIGAGALIWSTLLRRVERASGGAVSSAITSEHDILDGIALSQLA